MKFDPISTSRSAKAGNVKFAGKVKNCVWMELFQLPVAAESGESWLIENWGTRGNKKARRTPALDNDGR